MTDHDRLRRALFDLASTPPPSGDRMASVAHRAVVRRRLRAGGGAALMVVALVAGAFAGGAVQPPRAVSFLQIAGDDDRERSGSSTEVSDSPRATPRPSRTPSQGPRSASAQPSPRPSRRASERPSASPGSPAPLAVRVGVRPAEPTAGDRAVVRIAIHDGDGVVLGVRVTFGDGQEVARRFDAHCDGAHPQPSSRTVELPHVYEHAGSYVVSVTVRSGECGATAERRDARARVRVLPRSGDRPSNGGALPVARAHQVRPDERTAGPADFVAVQVGGADSDGYVTRLVLDWGDGTEPSVVTYPLSECRVTDSGYPASRRGTTLRHVYAQDGTYEVRLRVVSTGCNGQSEQAATTTARVSDPMPSPSPTSSPRPMPRPSPSGSPLPSATHSP